MGKVVKQCYCLSSGVTNWFSSLATSLSNHLTLQLKFKCSHVAKPSPEASFDWLQYAKPIGCSMPNRLVALCQTDWLHYAKPIGCSMPNRRGERAGLFYHISQTLKTSTQVQTSKFSFLVGDSSTPVFTKIDIVSFKIYQNTDVIKYTKTLKYTKPHAITKWWLQLTTLSIKPATISSLWKALFSTLRNSCPMIRLCRHHYVFV